ncbi:uncharacterized protein Z520_10201 [Fonsecaea multimorphosa CBS 102226]|uniref:Heterokaryon incompatibility domain-containing protein n=1 Tax=Fonsecaea multimorphosa CBS 102226 TaxID=1442371 RepID=A0A0D2GX63_9EURO|nr:uncharacterized protein Z520_10201 [Fonsecaea multimorphosa CBS 102226]KIX94175.1 hypothetical protein Z520_10201 [Fonsecaea multimorphosa CBS 102226]OAL19528.1 hypothetical protein AYO22_09690 [Fonsecaea multimorphosa]
MKKFEYEDLLSEEYIRILELLPGRKDDAIRCCLTLEPRQNAANTYDAISYTWGTSTDRAEIICSNQILPITTNLADALRELRSKSPGHSQRLWVDAICINQDRSEEKNHQVKRLGEVYRDARQVFVWLGRDTGGIARDCFGLLERWVSYLDENFDIYRHTRNIPTLDLPHHLCTDAEAGSKLRKLMECSWFSRVWVLQEAALAKNCHLFWGRHSMSLAVLVEFACFCDGRTEITRLLGGDDSSFRYWRLVFLCVYRTYDNAESWRRERPLIRSLNEKHCGGRPGLFLDILQIGKSLSAKDARDHIYAFLGNPLAKSADGKLFLEPDYDKDEKEVYFDATLAFLRSRHEAPYILCFVQHDSVDEVNGSKAPSWIPKWTKPRMDLAPSYTIGNIGLSFEAGGPVDRLQYKACRGFRGERLLSLRGFIFDHLTWTSGLLKPENFALDRTLWDFEPQEPHKTYVDKLWNDMVLACNLQRGCSEVPPKRTLMDASFSYTLVTGYNNTRVVSIDEHRKRFQKYLRALENPDPPENHRTGVITARASRKELCEASRYEVSTRNCRDRQLALTAHGRFALVARFAKPGDACCVFLGMVTPFVVRQVGMEDGGTAKYHSLVGEAYVHGVMRGELLDVLDHEDVNTKEIVLM